MSNKPGRPIAHPATTADQPELDVSTPNFGQNYPSLYRFLKEKRETPGRHATGCMTIFWEDGVFKVSINDRPNGKSSFVSHGELQGALHIADRGIRSGTLQWRVNKQYRAKAKSLFA